MRTRRAVQLFAAILISVSQLITPLPASAALEPAERTRGKLPDSGPKNSTVIFEGMPVPFELKWSLLTAKEGELIPADMFSAKGLDREPQMAITFRGSGHIRANSGLKCSSTPESEGGDCGATYATGLSYLLYAYVSKYRSPRCRHVQPRRVDRERQRGSHLRYLQNEHPAAEDLASVRRWTEPESTEQRKRRQRAYEEERKRYAARRGGSAAH